MREQDATVLVNFNREEEITRLLDQTYTELGKAYYDGGFEDPLPQLLPLFDRITNLKKELEHEKREHAAAGENAQGQPAPGAASQPEIPPMPGAASQPEIPSMPETAPRLEPAPQPHPAPQSVSQNVVQEKPHPVPQKPTPHKFCIYCGSRLQPGDAFCSNCGHKIG